MIPGKALLLASQKLLPQLSKGCALIRIQLSDLRLDLTIALESLPRGSQTTQ